MDVVCEIDWDSHTRALALVVAGDAIKRRRFVAATSCAVIEPPALVSSP
jgi:hypothetical protein